MNKKYLSIKEFREIGFLQEANRKFFHPLGLALEIHIDDDGKETLSGIWDSREDPEGIYFNFKNSDEKKLEEAKIKAVNVECERSKHLPYRLEMFDSVIEKIEIEKKLKK